MISIRTSPGLLEHLSTYELDGETVGGVLFTGGRLDYPGRKDIEFQLGYVEPYTLELEARVIDGLPPAVNSAISFLAGIATEHHRGKNLTLDLLWGAHVAWRNEDEGPSLDRLVAALVAINDFKDQDVGEIDPDDLNLLTTMTAAETVVATFHNLGFPLTELGLEELFDGADPAALGLGLVGI